MENTGLLPQANAPEGQPTNGPQGVAPEVGFEGEPNVAPEEQAQYEQFVGNGLKMIFSDNGAESIVQRLRQEDSPIEALASTSINVITALQDSAKQKGAEISHDVLLQGGIEIMENIAELSKRAKVHEYSEEEMENALYMAMDLYGSQEVERGTLDKDILAEDLQTLTEADKAGKMDELIPGITDYAAKLGSKEG